MDERTAGNLELVGGWACLDFANTVSTRDETRRGLHREYLTSYDQLIVWSQHASLLCEEEAMALLQTAAAHPTLVAAALDRAISVRETIYAVFSAIAHSRKPSERDLAAMNHALHEALSHLEIAPSGGGFRWAWIGAVDALERMVWPIVRSAGDLLTSEDLGRVRECAREGCDWLFVDKSKNQSRRWCSMNTCGSRVKARRYYHRRKESEHTPEAHSTASDTSFAQERVVIRTDSI
jgi:predicted RNA-binding Zn ribbon-like protein